jgi:hypothetical protein
MRHIEIDKKTFDLSFKTIFFLLWNITLCNLEIVEKDLDFKGLLRDLIFFLPREYSLESYFKLVSVSIIITIGIYIIVGIILTKNA